MAKATRGSTVTVHYTIKLDDGSLVDSSSGRDPLEITLGGGDLFPAVEEALVGMETGESTAVRLPAEDAFGTRSQELVLAVERSSLPDDMDPQVGMQLGAEAPDGSVIRLLVTAVEGDKVTLDGNHPLADQALNVDVELVSLA